MQESVVTGGVIKEYR